MAGRKLPAANAREGGRMLTSIFHAGSFMIQNVVLAMAFSLVLGALIAVIYRICCPAVSGFTVVLAALPFLVTSVIMIVNGNLGTSVAVLGAFGLIRFRSAPGTAREILFIFWSMAVGLATGMGFLSLAVLVNGAGAVWIVFLEKFGFGNRHSMERQLRITIPEDLEYAGIFDDVFARYSRRAQLENVRTTNMGTMYELTYRLEMRPDSGKREKEMLDELRCRNGNLTIIFGLVPRGRNEF